MKKALIYGACALMTLGMASCHADDPLYNNATAPTIQNTPAGLSGVVTDVNGNPVSGAKVTLNDNQSAVTDANGKYSIENVKNGSYTITVEGGNNLQGAVRDVTVAGDDNTQEYVENFTLYPNTQQTVNVTVANGGQGDVVSAAIPNNNEGKVEIAVEADANTVPEDVDIYITPIYTEESAAITKATLTDDGMLLGATVSCSKPNIVPSKDINVTFNVDSSVADVVTVKKLNKTTGAWETITADKTNGVIKVGTREFTSFGLFLDLKITENTSEIALTMNPNSWNNIAGTSNLFAGTSTYNYYSGTQINNNATNVLQGLLIEYMARKYGMTVNNLTGSYPVEQSINIGYAIYLTGTQEKNTLTIAGGNQSVSGTTYGAVKVIARVTNAGQHNGGGN